MGASEYLQDGIFGGTLLLIGFRSGTSALREGIGRFWNGGMEDRWC